MQEQFRNKYYLFKVNYFFKNKLQPNAYNLQDERLKTFLFKAVLMAITHKACCIIGDEQHSGIKPQVLKINGKFHLIL